jgi:ribosomal protein L11 methyltransferase
MRYYEYTFTYTSRLDTDIINAVWASELGRAGFDSFEETADGLKGYISAGLHHPARLNEAIRSFPLEGVVIHYAEKVMEDKDWNEEWVKNYFKPIVIGNQCIIHAPFQTVAQGYTYDIVVHPKMAFGTGHHETTFLMICEILKSELAGKAVLDMGCGTAVLAILAARKGAAPVVAIDIDEWAYNNAIENTLLNQAGDIRILRGGAELLPNGGTFDVVLANINRNILLRDLPRYAACMNPGAILLMSGFYTEDIPAIQKESACNGLSSLSQAEKNQWAMVKVQKK